MKAFILELFQARLYKRTQGRITRQVTFAALAVACLALAARLYDMVGYNWSIGWGFGLSGLLFALGVWVSYRAVNLPSFADFLIAVEAEMNKVSWPTRMELYRSSVVVLVVIFVLAVVLYAFDLTWALVFEKIGVL